MASVPAGRRTIRIPRSVTLRHFISLRFPVKKKVNYLCIEIPADYALEKDGSIQLIEHI